MRILAYAGTLFDKNGNGISFLVDEKWHLGCDIEATIGGASEPEISDFHVAVYIDPDDYENALPGTYTGPLVYDSLVSYKGGGEEAGEFRAIMLTLVISPTPTPTSIPTVKSGWVQEDNNWFYYKNGEKVTGWLKSGGKWYHLSETTGEMQTGFLNDSGKVYYLDGSGSLVINKWFESSGKWYHTDGNGALMLNKWTKDGKSWYYLGSTGAMVTSKWIKSGGKWYYLDKKGVMVAGKTIEIGGKEYSFGENGVWIG